MGQAKRKRDAGYTPAPTDLLDELMGLAERHARKVLLEERMSQLTPVFHLVDRKGDHFVVATPWSNDFEKRGAIAVVKDMSRKRGCTHVMFLSEGWMQRVAEGEKFRLPIREQPDRVEVVTIYVSDGRETRMRMLLMVRDRPGGRLIDLAPLPRSDGVTESALVDGIIVPPEERAA